MKEKLTKHDEKRLSQTLAEVAQQGGMDLLQAKGFLAHLHCHPRTLDPAGWSSAIAGVEPEKEYWPFEAKVMEQLFTLFNQLHDEVHQKQRLMPKEMAEHLTALNERSVPQPLRHWLAGFMTGFVFLKEPWQELLSDEQFEEVESCASLLGYVATLGSEEEHALAWREGADPEPQQLIEAVNEALAYMHGWSQIQLDDEGELAPVQSAH
ncbi:UPF0149 family protein [Ferrimonas balearica]|uniref:UPF0149 family protein n=1 Tax=Ferrimonas balearica TaxID=44012 RepID=UPI001C99B8D3|nr:UPF0149 family protein [Ferrimonas balearica]MBY5991117.1 UPF0149 family protein [Ferrimonas balearica]